MRFVTRGRPGWSKFGPPFIQGSRAFFVEFIRQAQAHKDRRRQAKAVTGWRGSGKRAEAGGAAGNTTAEKKMNGKNESWSAIGHKSEPYYEATMRLL